MDVAVKMRRLHCSRDVVSVMRILSHPIGNATEPSIDQTKTEIGLPFLSSNPECSSNQATSSSISLETRSSSMVGHRDRSRCLISSLSGIPSWGKGP